MMRREDWPERLREYFEAAEKRPFSWGNHNCCHFAAGAVVAQTDVDPTACFTGTNIRGRVSAYKRVRAFAGGGVRELTAKISEDLGMDEVVPAMAGRGDIVCLEIEGCDALGVVDLNPRNARFLLPERGLVRLPVLKCVKAWKVE